MFRYVAYGLVIESELRLPELPAAEGAPDAYVRFDRVHAEGLERSPSGVQYRVTPDEICLRYEGIGTFAMRKGAEIAIDAAPNVEERVLRLYILGACLGMLLQQRGMLILHGSAVAWEGAAVAFVGNSGWGKSTTAGALHRRGLSVVTDDIVAVSERDGRPTVAPGFPQLKLWPEAAASLGVDVESLPKLHPLSEKRGRPVREQFVRSALPLAGVYVLAEGEALAIERLEGQAALVELLRHSYGLRLLHGKSAPAHLKQCARIVEASWVRTLRRPRDIEQLGRLAELVVEDLGRAAV